MTRLWNELMKGIPSVYKTGAAARTGRLLFFFSKSKERMLGGRILVSVYNSAKAARPARPTRPPAARWVASDLPLEVAEGLPPLVLEGGGLLLLEEDSEPLLDEDAILWLLVSVDS